MTQYSPGQSLDHRQCKSTANAPELVLIKSLAYIKLCLAIREWMQFIMRPRPSHRDRELVLIAQTHSRTLTLRAQSVAFNGAHLIKYVKLGNMKWQNIYGIISFNRWVYSFHPRTRVSHATTTQMLTNCLNAGSIARMCQIPRCIARNYEPIVFDLQPICLTLRNYNNKKMHRIVCAKGTRRRTWYAAKIVVRIKRMQNGRWISWSKHFHTSRWMLSVDIGKLPQNSLILIESNSIETILCDAF